MIASLDEGRTIEELKMFDLGRKQIHIEENERVEGLEKGKSDWMVSGRLGGVLLLLSYSSSSIYWIPVHHIGELLNSSWFPS